MVGYVDGTANGISWDSQKLGIAMVEKSTNTVYNEPDGQPYFAGLEFRAPSKGESGDNNNEGLRIYKEGSYAAIGDNADKGVLEYKYYPVTGNYTFYGWHIDDAKLTLKDEKPDTVFGISEGAKQALLKGIQINGTQDLLAANTIEIPAALGDATSNPYYTAGSAVVDSYADMVDKQFSARTARNGFTPILNFKHTLARLEFFVKSGKGSDAALNYMKEEKSEGTTTYVATGRNGYEIMNAVVNDENPETAENYDNWAGTDEEFTKYSEAGMLNGAIYVTSVKLLGVYDNVELDLVNQTANIKAESAKAADGFALMSSPTQNEIEENENKNLVALKAVAPKYAYGYKLDAIDNSNGTSADKVGESIMYLPVAEQDAEGKQIGTDQIIKIQVQLGQCLIKTEDEKKDDNNPTKFTYYWDTPKPVTLVLNASNIKVPAVEGETPLTKEFAVGRSYNVYITIYGRERIELSANLVPWVEGGDIDTDIEEDYE